MKTNSPISLDDLKKMTRTEVHEIYKEMLVQMLIDFYFDSNHSDFEPETLADLLDFCKKWIENRINNPQKDWKPGDENGM